MDPYGQICDTDLYGQICDVDMAMQKHLQIVKLDFHCPCRPLLSKDNEALDVPWEGGGASGSMQNEGLL